MDFGPLILIPENDKDASTITTYHLSSFRCATSLSTHLIPSVPIFSPRRAVQTSCHLPTLFFHIPNLLEHIPALLSLLLVVLPSSSSASHIPILDLTSYSSTLSPVWAAQPPCPLTQSLLSDGQPLGLFTCSSQLSSRYPTVFSLQTSCLPRTISSQPSYLPSQLLSSSSFPTSMPSSDFYTFTSTFLCLLPTLNFPTTPMFKPI